MTGEEFSAVLKLMHPKLDWNYGGRKGVAGIVLRDGSANPVKLVTQGYPDALPFLIEKFMKDGVEL